MLASSAAGFAFGVFIVALYLETSLFHAVFLNNSLLVGFLVSCSVLFSPIGKFNSGFLVLKEGVLNRKVMFSTLLQY